MRKGLLLGLLIVCVLPMWGQTRDTAYVETFSDKLLLSPYLRYRSIGQGFFAGGAGREGLIAADDLGIDNVGLGLGLRAAMGRLGIGGTMPLATIYPTELERSKSYGLSGELMYRKIVLGGGIRYRIGFNTRQGTENVFREDLRRVEISVSSIYAFKHDRFSFRGPLRLVERQKQTAGSLLLALQVQNHIFWADSSLTAGSNDPLSFQNYTHFNLMPGLGYGGTLVLGDWYASMVLLAYAKISLLNLDQTPQPTSIGVRPHGRFAFGYHSNKWFLSLNGLVEQDLNWGSKAVILEAQKTFYIAFGIRLSPPPKIKGGGEKIERWIY
ncbi:MAG: DUF4421 family protein [Bacteroidota bacterium]